MSRPRCRAEAPPAAAAPDPPEEEPEEEEELPDEALVVPLPETTSPT